MYLLEDRRHLIYKAISPSGKVYIGKTCHGLNRRKKQHYSDAKRNPIYPIHHAINKYNLDIKWDVVKRNLTESEANKYETYYIKAYNSKEYGYNCTDGGEGITGMKFSAESKKKMSDSALNRFKDIGYAKKHQKSQKKRYSDPKEAAILRKNNSDYWDNPESRKKQSKRQVDFLKDPKNREALVLRKGGKKFNVFKIDGTFIGSWLSQSECARELSLTQAGISACLLKKQNTHKGYKFEYLGEEITSIKTVN